MHVRTGDNIQRTGSSWFVDSKSQVFYSNVGGLIKSECNKRRNSPNEGNPAIKFQTQIVLRILSWKEMREKLYQSSKIEQYERDQKIDHIGKPERSDPDERGAQKGRGFSFEYFADQVGKNYENERSYKKWTGIRIEFEGLPGPNTDVEVNSEMDCKNNWEKESNAAFQ